MVFNNLVKVDGVQCVDVDEKLIYSLTKFIDNDLIFLKKIRLDNISSRKVLTGYYDVLRMAIEAIGLKQGYKIYSENGLTSLLLELDERGFSQKFNSFKQLRHSLVHGERNVSVMEVKIIKDEIISLILKLKRKYLN